MVMKQRCEDPSQNVEPLRLIICAVNGTTKMETKLSWYKGRNEKETMPSIEGSHLLCISFNQSWIDVVM